MIYEVYMHNLVTDNKILIERFTDQDEAEKYVKQKNTNPDFRYYISVKGKS